MGPALRPEARSSHDEALGTIASQLHDPAMPKHLVVVLVYDQLCTFEFGCAVEIFGQPRAEFGENWYDFAICAEEPGPIRSTAGVELLAPYGLEKLREADTIIIPGWSSIHDPIPERISEALRQAHAGGARLVSICSGAFVLAATGLLDGRTATTHWLYSDVFRRRFPNVKVAPDVLYVDEGDILTSAGSAAGIDLMLHMIRRDHGARLCNTVARRLVVPPHRSGGQNQFAERPVPELEESRLASVIDHMRANAHLEQDISALAAMAAMSPRTFFRRFKQAAGLSPYDWLIRERVEIAKAMLEQKEPSVDQIAISAGFGAAATLRHHFRRAVGRSPAEYRRAFCAEPT